MVRSSHRLFQEVNTADPGENALSCGAPRDSLAIVIVVLSAVKREAGRSATWLFTS